MKGQITKSHVSTYALPSILYTNIYHKKADCDTSIVLYVLFLIILCYTKVKVAQCNVIVFEVSNGNAVSGNKCVFELSFPVNTCKEGALARPYKTKN